MNLKKMLGIAAIGALMFVGSNTVMAQGRGGFDPAQFRQRRIDRVKEQMDVKDESEWKAIEGQINKVMDAQEASMRSRFSGFGGGSTRSRGGSSGGSSTDSTSSSTDSSSSRRSRGGMFGGEPSPEVEALRKAVDDKAPADEIKAKLAAVKKVNKDSQKKLDQAQSDLRAILSVRQEAVAVLNGLLN
jgi:hypothetical protein